MLETAIQRRHPTGVKVHITTLESDLPSLASVWRDFGLCITRAKVRAFCGSAQHTFYLADQQSGRPPKEDVVAQVGGGVGGGVGAATADSTARAPARMWV